MTGHKSNTKLLSDIIVWSKYARYLPALNRRETWAEIVQRSAEMHIKKFPALEGDIWEAFSYVLNGKVVPSMRFMQFAGKTIELMPNRGFNCCYSHIDDYHVFSEIMFLLLGGSGVGYSVQSRHISQLPCIIPPRGTVRYVIGDDLKGWADAVKALMKAYFFGKSKPEFDYGDIREKGSTLITSGGKAPGPIPLRKALGSIQEILESVAYGDRLSSLQVFDITCYIAEAVLAGGIRRSATICLFDYDDQSMLNAKTGEWWIKNPQRALANISAVLDRRKLTKESFDHVFDITQYSGSGEPGLCLTNDPDIGTNPCFEASLRNMNMCNLSELLIEDESQEEFEKKVRAAAFIGTLQASYTDFWYLRPEWKIRAEQDALLGISITGLAGKPKHLDLEKAGRAAVEENERVARLIGINPALRVNVVKPSGTTSLVMGTSSGIHAWYAPYYIRRIQLNKVEPLYQYVKEAVPELVKDYYLRPDDTSVLSIPMKAPEDAMFRDEGALNTLARVKEVYETWIKAGHKKGLNTHNVSCTVNVKEDEWVDVREWMWTNRDSYAGISLLPYDTGTYKQAPYEEIDEATYEALSEYITEIDLTKIQEEADETNLTGEQACGGPNGCEVT